LRADVVALAVQGGRIMDGEEYFQHFAEGHDVGIERNLHHLGMAGCAFAYRFIAGINHPPAGIARLDSRHALQLLIDRLQAPKAPAAQSRHFACHDHSPISVLPIVIQPILLHSGNSAHSPAHFHLDSKIGVAFHSLRAF